MAESKNYDGWHCIYAVVVPKPDPDGKLAPIKRETGGTEIDDEFVFWFKLGDTKQKNPKNRTKAYKNPDQQDSVAEFEKPKAVHQACVDASGSTDLHHPAKQLELKNLMTYKKGGMGQAKSSEWHALYAKDENHASMLSISLAHFMKQLEGKDRSYEQVEDLLEKLLNSEGLTKSPIKNEGGDPRQEELEFVRPRWELIITPSVDYAAHNYGIRGKWWFRVDRTKSKQVDEDVMRTEFMTELPDFSYGCRDIVENAEEDERSMEKKVGKKFIDKLTQQGINFPEVKPALNNYWQEINGEGNDLRKIREALLKVKKEFMDDKTF